MIYKHGNRNIRIPDSDIDKFMRNNGITKDEAVQMWLEDEGYLDNEEQNELCQKAKENRITATIHQASAVDPKKKTQRERVKKDNPTKERVIAATAELLRTFADNVTISNPTKMIHFELDGHKYDFNLIQKNENLEKKKAK